MTLPISNKIVDTEEFVAEGNFSFPDTFGTEERKRKEERSFQGFWVDANWVVGGYVYIYDFMTAFGFVYTDTV